MKKKAFSFVIASLLTVAALLTACGQQAEKAGSSTTEKTVDFPSKPIKIIVPLTPGGTADSLARLMAQTASKKLPNGQAVVVENKPGGGGILGTTEVIKAASDGHTLGLVTVGTLSLQPHYGETAYTYSDATPIMRVVSIPHVIVVKADAPWKTFEEWLAYVKENPSKITVGAYGKGSLPHIGMEEIQKETGIKIKGIPFDGTPQMLNAVLGGHIDAAHVSALDTLPLVEGNKLRVLINTSNMKYKEYSDIPSLKEKGFDVDVDTPLFLIAPKDLPVEIRDILHDVFKDTLEDPSVIEGFAKLKTAPAYVGTDESMKIIEDGFNKNGEVLKSIGLIE